MHGVLLLVSVVLLPAWLNLIPLSCLAAILLVTGVKLARPAMVRRMWDEGRYQFIPFAATVVAIVLTDLLIGVLIGLAVSVGFILTSNLRRPIRRIVEKHLGGEVVRIELANQVGFLNRAALDRALDEVPRGGHVLLDAQNTDYIDPDVLNLIRDFKEKKAPARGVDVSLLGFRGEYQLRDQTLYVDYSTRDLQSATHPGAGPANPQGGPREVPDRSTSDAGPRPPGQRHGRRPAPPGRRAQLHRLPHARRVDLRPGDGRHLQRPDRGQHLQPEGAGQHGIRLRRGRRQADPGHGPYAVRRRDGRRQLRQHGRVRRRGHRLSAPGPHRPRHPAGHRPARRSASSRNQSPAEKGPFVDDVARRNVARVVEEILQESQTLGDLVADGRIAIVGAMYDVATGNIEFLPAAGAQPRANPGSGLTASCPCITATVRPEGTTDLRHPRDGLRVGLQTPSPSEATAAFISGSMDNMQEYRDFNGQETRASILEGRTTPISPTSDPPVTHLSSGSVRMPGPGPPGS